MSRERSPKEFKPFTEPTIYQDFADGTIAISFLEEEQRFFFLGFPREGHTLPIEIEEIPDIIEMLCKIVNCLDHEE